MFSLMMNCVWRKKVFAIKARVLAAHDTWVDKPSLESHILSWHTMFAFVYQWNAVLDLSMMYSRWIIASIEMDQVHVWNAQ